MSNIHLSGETGRSPVRQTTSCSHAVTTIVSKKRKILLWAAPAAGGKAALTRLNKRIPLPERL